MVNHWSWTIAEVKGGALAMNRIVMLIAVVMLTAFGPNQKAVSQAAHATLSQQKQCAEQAKRSFNEDFGPGASDEYGMHVHYDYTSHFDAKKNVCYLLVKGLGTSPDPVQTADVYDAYERRQYASYFWINPKGKKYWEVAPYMCWVQPNTEEI